MAGVERTRRALSARDQGCADGPRVLVRIPVAIVEAVGEVRPLGSCLAAAKEVLSDVVGQGRESSAGWSREAGKRKPSKEKQDEAGLQDADMWARAVQGCLLRLPVQVRPKRPASQSQPERPCARATAGPVP
jgi:hypothetical protein